MVRIGCELVEATGSACNAPPLIMSLPFDEYVELGDSRTSSSFGEGSSDGVISALEICNSSSEGPGEEVPVGVGNSPCDVVGVMNRSG